MKDNLSVLTDSEQVTLEKNPLRLLDSKNVKIKDALSSLPPLYESLNEKSQKRFDSVTKLLNQLETVYYTHIRAHETSLQLV